MRGLADLDVIILAGGFGTRLASLFPDLPKSMVPVGDRPFLHRQIAHLRSFGASRILLALGHQHELIEDYVSSQSWGDLQVICVVEPSPRGTGGAVAEALPFLKTDRALVLNGDSFTKADLETFREFHGISNAELSMIATHVPDTSRFGKIETDTSGRVLSSLEKPKDGGPGFINCGIYLAERSVLESIPGGRACSLEREVLPRLSRLYAWKGQFPFIDLGTPESYRLAASFFESLQ
jgi:NDP-sugar pyrophosphorylase family protein